MSSAQPSSPFPGYTTTTTATPWEPAAPPSTRSNPTIHLVLFILTFATTSFSGASLAGADPFEDWTQVRLGLPFAVTLMTILLCHEMGHYIAARYYRVDATLPYFIPAPPVFLVGTFGAFIRMKSPPPGRKALFDVGAAGPWAGIIVAIPAIIIGLKLSEVRPAGLAEAGNLVFGEPPLFYALSYLTLGPLAPGMDVFLHPVATAGWFGLFVTFLNLIPVSQLDGGHVSYAFLGRGHRLLARAFFAILVVLAFTTWPGWFLWVAVLLVFGLDHPPTLDSWTPLDPGRRIASCLTALLFLGTFMTVPLKFSEPSPTFEGEKTPVTWQERAPRSHHRPRLFPMRAASPPKGIPL
jgi:membrane-associated protease RseP (regulator of RpoE activity)